MRIIAIIALIALLVIPCIAELDSVTTGPYKISFDLGLNKSDYEITVEAPQTTEELDGTEKTNYNLQIFSINMTKLNESGINKSMFINLTASDIARLFVMFDAHVATIGIREFKDPQQVAAAGDYVDILKQIDGSYPGFKASSREIDGAEGGVASANIIIDPNNPVMTSFKSYHIVYQPTFDPSYVVVEIASIYPWDEGTLQLLKTIHVEKINSIT
jgi:hypothetical protein